MALSIKYGDYTFPIMPTFSPKISYEYDEAKSLSYIQESWPMEVVFHTSGAEALNTLYNALKTALEVDNATVQLLKSGVPSPLQEIKADDCFWGPRCTNLGIKEPRQGLLVTNMQMDVTIEARRYSETPTGPTHKAIHSLTYSEDIYGLLTVSETINYEGPGAITPATGDFSFKGGNDYLFSWDYNINHDQTTASATGNWKEIRQPYPSFVGDGSYSMSGRNEQGLVRYTASGSFTVKKGKTESEIKKWVLNKFSSSYIVSKEFQWDSWSGTLTFTITWLESRSLSGVIYFAEGFSIEKDFQMTSKRPTLDGYPIKQKGGWTGTTVRQEGEVRSLNAIPVIPEPFWNGDNLISAPSISIPKPTWIEPGGYALYIATYSYNHHLNSDKSVADIGTLLKSNQTKHGPRVSGI